MIKIKDIKYIEKSRIYFYLKNLLADMITSIKKSHDYLKYIEDWRTYILQKKNDSFIRLKMRPILGEKTEKTSFDSHYFYQDIWAFKRILESECDTHIDVGSKVYYVGFLSSITKVTFIDIRTLKVNLDNFASKKGSILSLPYKKHSILSLSCLHVAEHIGLGRYGDDIDPNGTKKAAAELSRVLAPGGNLYFSVPIGKPKLVFNAHRIHSTGQIIKYFSHLELKELSGVNDKGIFKRNIKNEELNSCNYGLGLFWFVRK